MTVLLCFFVRSNTITNSNFSLFFNYSKSFWSIGMAPCTPATEQNPSVLGSKFLSEPTMVPSKCILKSTSTTSSPWFGQDDPKLYCSFKFLWVSGISQFNHCVFYQVLILPIHFVQDHLFSFWRPMCFFKLNWGCFYISTKFIVL